MENKNWDEVIRKYMKIWIWSILFGANSTLTYALSSTFVRENWGVLAIGVAVTAFYGVILVLISWRYLINFFSKSILPSLFSNEEYKFSNDELKTHAAYLERALKFMVYASIIMFLTKIIEIILISFNKY